MDYMKETQDFIERMADEVTSDEAIVPYLKANYETIKKISDCVSQTQLYLDNVQKTTEYLEHTKDYTLLMRYMDFMNKLVRAPFQLALTGVVIFHMPILEKTIREELAAETKEAL